MADAILDVKGDKELIAALRGLEPKLLKKAFRRTFRVLGKIAADATRANVPVKTGALKRSVKVRAVKRTRKGTVGVNVISGGKLAGAEYYGHFVEYGTKKMAARRFMRHAYESKVAEMRAVGLEMLKVEVEQAIVESRK